MRGGWEDPRSTQGILSRGSNNYNGIPHSQGAGRPSASGLGFDLETIQRRLLSSAAQSRF